MINILYTLSQMVCSPSQVVPWRPKEELHEGQVYSRKSSFVQKNMQKSWIFYKKMVM